MKPSFSAFTRVLVSISSAKSVPIAMPVIIDGGNVAEKVHSLFPEEVDCALEIIGAPIDDFKMR